MKVKSLYHQVLLGCSIYLSLICLAWSLALAIIDQNSEDRVFERQLRLTRDDYQRALETDPHAKLPDSPFIRMVDISFLPDEAQQHLFHWQQEVIYEYAEERLHLTLVKGKPGQVMILDGTHIKEPEMAEVQKWFLRLLVISLVCSLPVVGFGIWFARKTIEPLQRLSQNVANIEMQSLPKEDWQKIQPEKYEHQELRQLAFSLRQTLKRLSEYIAREQAFTQTVSHELRTPVTVIQGALDILQHRHTDDKDRRVLSRIERANQRMLDTIEMFLGLARERSPLAGDKVNLNALIDALIEQQRHASNSSTNYLYQSDDDVTLEVDAMALSTVITNVLRNASQHSPQGSAITLHLTQNQFTVTNAVKSATAVKLTNEPVSYGLGLAIVDRLCSIHHWQFSLVLKQEVAIATVEWKTSGKKNGDDPQDSSPKHKQRS